MSCSPSSSLSWAPEFPGFSTPEPPDLGIELDLRQLIRLSDLPSFLPLTNRGKKIHLATVYRWASAGGLRGVQLDTFYVGGVRYTTQDALDRFSRALGHAKQQPMLHVTHPKRRRQREQAQKRVHQILRGRTSRGAVRHV